MASYLDIAKELKGQLLNCDLQHILRSKNARADKLAKLATLQIEDLDPHVHVEALEVCSTEEPKWMLPIEQELSWMDPILCYLKIGALFNDRLSTHKVSC